jgi:syntaxin 5
VCRQPLLGGGQAQQDQQLVVHQDAYMSSRAAALQNVESTIHELGGIFQQLAHMVRARTDHRHPGMAPGSQHA